MRITFTKSVGSAAAGDARDVTRAVGEQLVSAGVARAETTAKARTTDANSDNDVESTDEVATDPKPRRSRARRTKSE